MRTVNLCPNGNRTMSVAFWASYMMTLLQFGTDVYLPSFPTMVHALHTNATSIQLSLTLFVLGYAISQPFYGPLSDRFGRKPLLLFGLGAYWLTSLCLALSPNVTWLLVFRLLQGLGAGATSVLARAMLRDSFSGKPLERVSAFQAFMWSFVPIVAPVIGGYVQHYLGWRWQFGCLTIVASIGLMGIACVVKETNLTKVEHINIKFIVNGYANAIRTRVLVGNILVMGGAGATILGFLVAAPFIFQGLYGFKPVGYGWLILLMASGCVFGTVLNRLLLRWFSSPSINRVVVLLNIAFAAALFVVALTGTKPALWAVVVLAFVILMLVTISYPNAIAAAMQHMKQQIGISTSLIGMSVFGVCGVVTFIMAHLPEHSVLPVASLLLVVSGLIFGGARFARK